MKKHILILAIIALSGISINSSAQTKPAQRGSWVVESNQKQPKIKTVKFYNEEQQLIYSETLNCRLNISRKKIQGKLYLVLDALLSGIDSAKKNNLVLSAINKNAGLHLLISKD